MVLSRACRTEMPGKFSHEISNSALHFYQTVTKPWSPEPWAAAWAAPSPLGVSVGNPDAEGPPQVQSLERTQGCGSGVALSGGGGEGAGLHIWPFDEIAKLRVGGRQGALKLQSRGPGDVCGRHWKNVWALVSVYE